MGQAVWLLQPIVDGIRRHVFAAEKIHGDDTPVRSGAANLRELDAALACDAARER